MAQYRTVTVAATVTPGAVSAVASVHPNIFAADAEVCTRIVSSEAPEYAGPYTVTPSDDAQTLATEGYLMTGNVVVNPIPSNYGRITWNGSFLTVS